MGRLYMTSLHGFKTPTEYLDNQFTFDRKERSYRVLRSSLVQMRRYYAAVERVEKASGERRVIAVVCLVNYNTRERACRLSQPRDTSVFPVVFGCERAMAE